MPVNEFGQPIGSSLDGWSPPEAPPVGPFVGRWVTVRPLAPFDYAPLFEALGPADGDLWTYLFFGPFNAASELADVLEPLRTMPDWRMFAIEVHDRPVGFAGYLRIDLGNGSIEIGSIAFSPELQRTTAATEALSMMIGQAFDAGFRRVEWKCDDLNGPSRRAAERLGFHFEGVFRNATHYKGRSRDTAWFAITDDEWPAVRAAHAAWLDESNFDADGRQRQPLRAHM